MLVTNVELCASKSMFVLFEILSFFWPPVADDTECMWKFPRAGGHEELSDFV